MIKIINRAINAIKKINHSTALLKRYGEILMKFPAEVDRGPGRMRLHFLVAIRILLWILGRFL